MAAAEGRVQRRWVRQCHLEQEPRPREPRPLPLKVKVSVAQFYPILCDPTG